ncbi:MAG: helix-turn-helix transcriptional regulator [Elusimicrobiota bacterium]
MSNNWLWDQKISDKSVRKILKNPEDKKYLKFAVLLLSRKNVPKEVFTQYINPVDFCRNWQGIKKIMKKNKWNDPRIEFWQAIYERLMKKYRIKNVEIIQSGKVHRANEFCKSVGEKIRDIRVKKELTQGQLAKKLDISQQLISRIESGKQNISILTLKKISLSLNSELIVDLKLT